MPTPAEHAQLLRIRVDLTGRAVCLSCPGRTTKTGHQGPSIQAQKVWSFCKEMQQEGFAPFHGP